MFTRYIRTDGTPQGCPGDSGGPLFTVSAGNRIAGITSFLATDGSTNFTRVANVDRWIKNPNKLNVIADQEMGFLLNRGLHQCLEVGPFNGFSPTVFTAECNGANQPVDQQYWKLIAVPGTTFFQFQNTSTLDCMDGRLGSQSIGAPCDAASSNQHWTFTIAMRSPSLPPFLRIVNRHTAQCLSSSSGAPLGSPSMKPCDHSDQTQDWMFFP
jgi:hypothetical protein